MVEEKDCYEFLKSLNIDYEVLSHKAVFTIEEAAAELPGKTEVKNLFIQDDKGKRQYLVIMPGLKKLDLKQLAIDIGEKKVRFCSPEKVENMLGVKPGSVSLFCCLNQSSNHVEIVFDEDLLSEKEIGFHPIINTATVYIESHHAKTILNELPQNHKLIKL